MPVLILRPEPGASATAARAGELGLDAVVAPLFSTAPVEWQPPPVWVYDAVILTSANAARLGGEALADLTAVPCYVVGETTALSAQDAGFTDIRVGSSDGDALVALMAEAGVTEALRLCGRDHHPLGHPDMRIEERVVYAADAVDTLPPAASSALAAGALALLHSPRAAEVFARLVDEAGLAKDAVDLVLISPAAADAAGKGWRSKAVAREPRDAALLELAAELCQTGAGTHGTQT